MDKYMPLRTDTAKQIREIRRILRGNEPIADDTPPVVDQYQPIRPKQRGFIGLFCIILALTTIFLIKGCESPAKAYTLDQWADAIHTAENGVKHNKGAAYGILSVKYKNDQDARRICKRTVWHKYLAWKRAGSKGEFLQYLASKYCPLSDKRDKGHLNKNWISNVGYYLKKGA